jgi:hypothetical protein
MLPNIPSIWQSIPFVRQVANSGAPAQIISVDHSASQPSHLAGIVTDGQESRRIAAVMGTWRLLHNADYPAKVIEASMVFL